METRGAPNLYDAIGVNAGASAEKIRKKTRRLIHDVRESGQTDEEKIELIRFFKSARDTLCNPDSRREYDATIGIETVGASDECTQEAAVVPFELASSIQHPFGALGALGALGSVGALGPLESVGSVGAFGGLGSHSPGSALMTLMGSDLSSMFSDSIVPEELAKTSPGDLKRGTFQVLEYTKVRNPEGGYDEFGFTRQGDMKHDRVTEKRFERKS